VYLKSIEMIGFKSFASKTKLVFEPGLTAIVGPNGCGKSNIADAVRWVIGEQSAKAMRGSSMTDCIFSGTDDRRPLGMAEVSLTLVECEDTLGTDFHEVTISRRVFRSGEGQYFINKTPCRLKDIQRLFMDTGIGTTSYSLMEQGRIDRVLSSRPEDRRTIFEEASGITKYKADKKEAIRKLEHTEANLLRLADVIREVKRQIGSLQRQAGKARRYKAFREELRKLDILTTRERLKEADKQIQDLENDIGALNGKVNAAHREITELEESNSAGHDELNATEREISAATEAGLHAQSDLERTQDLIRMNTQRIQEYREWSERDTREIDETRRQLENAQAQLADLKARCESAVAEKEKGEADLKRCNDNYERHKEQIDAATSRIQQFRDDTLKLDGLGSRLQNQLVEIESSERSNIIRRERLAAEKTQLGQVLAGYEKRRADMQRELESLQEGVAQAESELQRIEADLAVKTQTVAQHRQRANELRTQEAMRRAQIDLLGSEEEADNDFPGGARALLDESNPLGVRRDAILGSLAAAIEVEPEYVTTTEAVLRPWLDAVLVSSGDDARELLRRLEERREGPARLLAVDVPAGTVEADSDLPGTPLAKHVRAPENVRPLLQALMRDVRVVDDCDALPSPLPADSVYVTRSGAVARATGAWEFWMTDPSAGNPLSRRHALAEARSALDGTERQIRETTAAVAGLQSEVTALEERLRGARTAADGSGRALAQKEGECQVVDKETTEARQRLETVTWELDDIVAQGQGSDDERREITRQREDIRLQRERIAGEIGTQTRELHALESRQSELTSEVTEHRVRFSSSSQRAEYLASQHDGMALRCEELEGAVRGRSEGIQSYQANIERLTAEMTEAGGRVAGLQETVTINRVKADGLRKKRAEQAGRLREQERFLAQQRAALEELRGAKSALDVRCAECRLQRRNQMERVTLEYNITADEVLHEFNIEWEDDLPSREECETRVAELRTKLEAMGPVNLVAIEEYKELEERYAFLTGQEEDLVKSKQQLMDMIRKINRTTSDMFRTTFEQVNGNFQEMFRKLFDGGTAQLVLVNEEDVLECGIEIIARPPGKRLQNISLLSGGERTLTAVALLFAIYMIKPSPFCLLDELDAPLDDSNIGRFIDVLKSFLQQSQFVIITHNQHTISAADILYGVTMPDKGISKIVSMKFQEEDRALPREPAAQFREAEVAEQASNQATEQPSNAAFSA